MKYQFLWTVVIPGIVSGLVSLFSKEIRTGLKVALHRGGKTLKERTISDLENQLGLITQVHDNAYNFLLWLCLEVRLLLIETAILLGVALLFRIRSPLVSVVIASLVVGAWTGRLFRISNLLGQLQHYDRSKAQLEGKIAYFKREWRQ